MQEGRSVRSSFIGLDYIVDITHPSGKLSGAAAQVAGRGVIAKANQALAIARERGWLTVLVRVGFSPGYPEQPKQSPLFGRVNEINALALGEAGTGFHPDLWVGLADLVTVKPRVSGFYGTNLDAALRANKIDRLIIAGVSSAWAVQATVRDAHDRDFQIYIAEDACAAADEEDHWISMRMLSRIAKIIHVDDMAAL